MVDLAATAIIAPLFFLLTFHLLQYLNEMPFQGDAHKGKYLKYNGLIALTAEVVKYIPGPHWAIRGHGPHKTLFVSIDICVVGLLLAVVYEMHISPSLTTSIIAAAIMVFIFFYPLLTWKQYWEILDSGITPMSYSVYFFYTFVLFTFTSRKELLYTLFEGDETILLSFFQPLTTMYFDTHPPLPEINRLSYILSNLDIIGVFTGAALMWYL